MNKVRKVQSSITLGALVIAFVHILCPSLQIDAVTVALVTIAAVPWLAPLFKSIELPGGLKIQFEELEQAKEDAEKAGLLTSPPPAVQNAPASSHQPLALLQTLDPNLALAGLRIEIERRLRMLARKHSIESTRYGVKWLLATLRLAKLLTPQEELVLERLTELMNSAVHGAEVDPRASAWAMQVGPALLETLDRKIAENEPPEPAG